MKQQFGRIARRRKYFARLYDDNPEWHREHQNDLIVFHKIAAIQNRTGERPLTIIGRLMKSVNWMSRLEGKSSVSWKVNYNR